MALAHLHTSRPILDKKDPLELILTIESFAGGENTVDEDQAVKSNEARIIENWDFLSLGGMIRSAGFNKVADGGASYSAASDLLAHHDESGSQELYGIIAGDLVKKTGSTIAQENAAAFTSGVLSHAVSAASALWITNATDNLKRKTIGVAIAAPASQPATACARIFNHKTRLVAEGSTSQPRRIYGSRAGTGNWTAADAWSLANDAWNIDLPNDTKGCVPEFPTADEILVPTKFKMYTIYNMPNVAFRPIPNSRGCGFPYTLAKGDEGVYFLSDFPTLGVFLFDGVQFIELTEKNRDVFVEKIDRTKRMFGVYRNRQYWLFYNETGSGASYPNRCRIYDARFGSWKSRPINSAYADNFGYPALLTKSQNELYVASSRDDRWYELDTGTDDEGNNTQATYKTKDFSSIDFKTIAGAGFPLDDVRLKLVKITVEYYGTVGSLSVAWNADRGKYTGSKTIDLTAAGDLLNTTFTVNSSSILGASSLPDRFKTMSFPNGSIGRKFNFEVTQNGQSTRPKVKKIKIHAVVYEEL